MLTRKPGTGRGGSSALHVGHGIARARHPSRGADRARLEAGLPQIPKRTAPAGGGAGRGIVWFIGLIARFANETSNLATGRGQPVAMPDPARQAHRIQSVWVCLVTTRQKLDCLPMLRSVTSFLLLDPEAHPRRANGTGARAAWGAARAHPTNAASR
jgi:hypothetical protein